MPGVPSPPGGNHPSRGALCPAQDPSEHWDGVADARAWLSWLQWRCHSIHSMPLQGYPAEQICPLCLVGHLDAVLQCHEDTQPITTAQGTGWWLWESLDLTSDLGQALTCRKDTASSYVNSCCCLCSPCPSASGCRQQGG